MGSNRDDFALFTPMFGLVVPGATLPLGLSDLSTLANYIVQYHQHWNSSHAQQIIEAYNSSEWKHDAARLSAFGTDLIFRCGTRAAARALAALPGVRTYLFMFAFEKPGTKSTDTLECQVPLH